MSKRDVLHGKKVVVMGFGRQGQALARWLPTVGAKVLVNDYHIAEELGIETSDYPDVDFILGRHPLSLLDDAHLVCVSGGVPLDHVIVKEAQARNIPLSNDAQLFLERCPAPVIGITGSAGKTTTTTLVGQIIERAGYKTWVGGNIGNVLLDDLSDIKSDDVVVMELSSFQLELMNRSPQVAAVLNLTPNHLDRHGTMESYVRAKANIIRFQTSRDIAVLNYDDEISKALEILVEGELVWFSSWDMVPDGTFLAGDRLLLAGAASFDYAPHVLCQRSDIPLRGEHNLSNVLAACAIAGALGLATDRPGISPEVMCEAIVNFKPVPHRLELVRELNGVSFVNDSIATAPERLLAALRSYTEPLILLLGGADKDLPWRDVLHIALQKTQHIIVFGKTGEKQVRTKVMSQLKLMGATKEIVSEVDTLDEAVKLAQKVAEAGDVVLLSPGGTSYDAYSDFAERGEHFRKLVVNL